MPTPSEVSVRWSTPIGSNGNSFPSLGIPGSAANQLRTTVPSKASAPTVSAGQTRTAAGDLSTWTQSQEVTNE
jgi:hypothetical protein